MTFTALLSATIVNAASAQNHRPRRSAITGAAFETANNVTVVEGTTPPFPPDASHAQNALATTLWHASFARGGKPTSAVP